MQWSSEGPEHEAAVSSTGAKAPRQVEVPASLHRFSALLARQTGAILWFLTLSSTVAVFALDVATGPELALSIFYLLPIALAVWHLGWRAGLIVVALSGLTWLSADVLAGRRYSIAAIQYWNALIRTGFFFVVAFTLTLLKQAITHEQALARTDTLTGILNSRGFLELAERELARARRARQPVTMAYIDVDGFKQVNDTRGHAAGDALLCAIGRTLQNATRGIDVIGRLGGDEFAILLPAVDPAGAATAVTRIMDQLSRMAAAGAWPVGFSAGVATFPEAPVSTETMIRLADDLMYSTKQQGGGAGYVIAGSSA